jgi:hypothetical protein
MDTETMTAINDLVAWLDHASPLDPDTTRILRCLKPAEEVGEVTAAVIGATGQNPAKAPPTPGTTSKPNSATSHSAPWSPSPPSTPTAPHNASPPTSNRSPAAPPPAQTLSDQHAHGNPEPPGQPLHHHPKGQM